MTTNKRPTLGSVTTDLAELRRQVQYNQERLDEKQGQLTYRVEELAGSLAQFKQMVETSREATQEIKKSIDAVQRSFEGKQLQIGPESPDLSPTLNLPGVTWSSLKKSSWYPWFKFGFWSLIGLVAYHLLFVPVLQRTVPQYPTPNLIRPTLDLSTPFSAATAEVSREPFRSDTASRSAFGTIFTRLGEQVRTGQITEFEGYYNEFSRQMQQRIAGPQYDHWAGFWNRIADVSHRYGRGATDLAAFHDNLATAARVVAGLRDTELSTGPTGPDSASYADTGQEAVDPSLSPLLLDQKIDGR